MQGRFRHWLTPGVQLVKRSRDWSGKVKQQERLGLGGIHWVTQPKPPSLFHFSATIVLFTITLCFADWMPGTGYSGTNHNHCNFFKCDWCISCFIFSRLILYSIIGQHNWTVGFNRIPVIGQLKQRIILSSVSQIHQSQSESQ